MCRLAVFIKVSCNGTLLTIYCYLSLNEGLVPPSPEENVLQMKERQLYPWVYVACLEYSPYTKSVIS